MIGQIISLTGAMYKAIGPGFLLIPALPFLALALVWIVLMALGFLWFLSLRRSRLTIAGGPRDSESFEITSALANVIQEAYPEMKVEVYETGGSGDSVRLLEEGRVDGGHALHDHPVQAPFVGKAITLVHLYRVGPARLRNHVELAFPLEQERIGKVVRSFEDRLRLGDVAVVVDGQHRDSPLAVRV